MNPPSFCVKIFQMLFYFSVFMVAFAITYLLTPVVRSFARRVGVVDLPGERKVHEFPVPRLGGLAIYAGFLLTLIFALVILYLRSSNVDYFSVFAVILGCTLILIVGILDDIKSLPAFLKFSVQIVVAAIVVVLGVRIGFVSNPFTGGIYSLSNWIVFPFTVLWIVGITNAINLIDGLDGLAVGISAISAGSLFIVALRTHQIGAAIMLLALFGASLAFLRYNFYPASMFLGDSGSYLLGFILATASVAGVLKSTLLIALMVPILILGVPIYDTISVIIRRLIARQKIFQADMRHIHHQMLRAGFSHRKVVLAIYGICIFLSLSALILTAINTVSALIVLGFIILMVIIATNIILTR